MKIFNVKPGGLPPVIQIPASKSYANRALILAALKPGAILLKNIPLASDVTFLIQALKKIGLHIESKDNSYSILNHFPECEDPAGQVIDIGEGGTTARFLACLLVLGRAPYTLILGGRLMARPWEDFLSIINSLGGKAKLDGNKLFIQGPLLWPDHLEVDCSKTTQFASGFKLALGFTPVEIVPMKLSSSLSYWEMTNQMIEHFKNHDQYTIPADWSSASYPLAFGALKQEIFFPGLQPDSFQADSKFYQILEQMNAIEVHQEGLKVHPHRHQGSFIFNASDCLDLVPALSFLLAHREGHHELHGIANLVFKESDRLQEVIKLLKIFGIKSSTNGQVLFIEGKKSFSVGPVDLELANDHRMVMTGAMFLRLHHGGSVSPAKAVEKSYPQFFDLLSK